MPVFIRLLLGRALVNRSAMWCQVLSSIDHIVIGLLSPLPETCLRLAYVTAMCRDMLVGRICYGCGAHMLRFWGVPYMRQSILTTM